MGNHCDRDISRRLKYLAFGRHSTTKFHQHNADHPVVHSFGHTLKILWLVHTGLNVGDFIFEKISYTFIIQLLEMKFKTELCAGSGHPSQAMPWVREKGSLR